MDESGAVHGSRPQPQPGIGGAPADRISTLSDDLLLQVLSHLGYASDAARTVLLSRRWRGLYSHLPELDVTLRDVPLGSLEGALRGVARPGMRLLDIAVPVQDWSTAVSSGQDPCGKDGGPVIAAAASISSVLREAASLSPAQLRFALPPNLTLSPADPSDSVHLPRFHRATSIDLRAPPYLRLKHSRDSTVFPALESLSISGCLDLENLIPLCPRLRVLTVTTDTDAPDGIDFTVQFFSLQGLVVDRSGMPTRNIIVQAPMLERLTMSFDVNCSYFSVSIFAPMVEKILWRCLYAHQALGIGIWELLELSLETIEGTRRGVGCSNTDHTGEDGCSQLPRINVLSLHMSSARRSFGFLDRDGRFVAEISKHIVTEFSGLELHLTTRGHAIGSLVWHLLGMHHIAKATQSLRIILLTSEVREACQSSCHCDGPSNWRAQLAFLPTLENLEIEGFEGEDHEFEFLKLMLGHAPMLTRVTVRLPDQIQPNDDCCTKLHDDIFAAYPSVEASVDVIPGN